MANTPQVGCPFQSDIMDMVLKNRKLIVGQELRVKGEILEDGKRFAIFMGCDPKNFAVHFNPRWDSPGGPQIIINSMTDGNWENEIKLANTLHRGSNVTIVMKLEDKYSFKIELPSGQTIPFQNRTGMEIDYIQILGDFKLMSFQIAHTNKSALADDN